MRIEPNQEELAKSPLQPLFQKIYNRRIVQKNSYTGKIRFPLGTFKPITAYKNLGVHEDIPDREIKWYEFDTIEPNNATSICAIGQSGSLKSTLMKRLFFYGVNIGNTKGGVLDLKDLPDKWERVNNPHNNPGTFPNENNIINMRCGAPDFAIQTLDKSEQARIKRMNLNPNFLKNPEIIRGLNFSPMAQEKIFGWLGEGKTFQQILEAANMMYQKDKRMKGTFDSIDTRVRNMIARGLIAKDNFFDINEIWDENKHWALAFNEKEEMYLSIYVDNILNSIRDRADSKKGSKERYLIIIDDAKAATNPERKGSSDESLPPSVSTCSKILTMWRAKGINPIFGIQNPTMMHGDIYGDIKHYFIYTCPKLTILNEYINNRNIIARAKDLDFRPGEYISQCLHVYPDKKRFEVFYPANAPIAN